MGECRRGAWQALTLYYYISCYYRICNHICYIRTLTPPAQEFVTFVEIKNLKLKITTILTCYTNQKELSITFKRNKKLKFRPKSSETSLEKGIAKTIHSNTVEKGIHYIFVRCEMELHQLRISIVSFLQVYKKRSKCAFTTSEPKRLCNAGGKAGCISKANLLI